MDYLKDRTFELFRYTLPGVFLISIFLLIDGRVSSPFNVYGLYFKEITTEFTFGLVITGFIAGIIIDQFSGILLRKITKKTKEPEYASNSDLTKPQKYALIREISPVNFYHIENWNAYKGMCDNLSFGFLILAIISVYKIFVTNEIYSWIASIFIAILSILSLLSKAKKFKQWAQQDIDSVIDMIYELDKKRK